MIIVSFQSLQSLPSDHFVNGNNTNKINDCVDKSILESPPDVYTPGKNTVMSGGPAGGAYEGGCGRSGGGGSRNNCERDARDARVACSCESGTRGARSAENRRGVKEEDRVLSRAVLFVRKKCGPVQKRMSFCC